MTSDFFQNMNQFDNFDDSISQYFGNRVDFQTSSNDDFIHYKLPFSNFSNEERRENAKEQDCMTSSAENQELQESIVNTDDTSNSSHQRRIEKKNQQEQVQQQQQQQKNTQSIELELEKEDDDDDDEDEKSDKLILLGSSKKIKKHENKNKDKNICRYITRRTIRCFTLKDYADVVMQLCDDDQNLYKKVTQYFKNRIEQITGFRVLKTYLTTEEEEVEFTDNEEAATIFSSEFCLEQEFNENKYKIIFKKFMKWFLKERALRYILSNSSKIQNKDKYIQYKNQVMLAYIDNPISWNSNKGKVKKNEF